MVDFAKKLQAVQTEHFEQANKFTLEDNRLRWENFFRRFNTPQKHKILQDLQAEFSWMPQTPESAISAAKHYNAICRGLHKHKLPGWVQVYVTNRCLCIRLCKLAYLLEWNAVLQDLQNNETLKSRKD